MKRLFVIGEKEKHEIEVDHSRLGKIITVRVDGRVLLEERLSRRGTFCRLKIGKEEKHEVELEYGGIFPKIRCFVDGHPHLRGRIIPSRWEKPVHIKTILALCILAALLSSLIVTNLVIGYIGEQLYGAKLPPYTEIENRNVNTVFRASDGTLHSWSITLEAWEAQTTLGWYKRKITHDIQYVELEDNETGEIHRVVDLRPFVIENNFTEVMSNLYHDLGNNDEAFIYEIWYTVTQLTTYHSEIEETPRFPLETMIGGGGDCEDMAILIAGMLKAAPADYVVELVYMDMDNPTDPQNVNHVLVWVETLPPSSPEVGEKWHSYKTFIDGTSKTVMCPFTEVDGWYFEV